MRVDPRDNVSISVTTHYLYTPHHTPVMLSPPTVILSAAKDLGLPWSHGIEARYRVGGAS